jgi:hypothetical protein
MPLNTRDVMRSDDHDSSSQLPIVFRYGTGSLAVMILGFPILLAMFVLFPIMSVHQLMRPVSFGMKLDAVAVCGLGLAFGWISGPQPVLRDRQLSDKPASPSMSQ